MSDEQVEADMLEVGQYLALNIAIKNISFNKALLEIARVCNHHIADAQESELVFVVAGFREVQRLLEKAAIIANACDLYY